MALSAVQVHARALCRPLLAAAPGWRAGELRLEARGLLDGAPVSDLQRTRQVEVILPLQASMLATQEARQRAEMADTWPPHPTRAAQTSALGRGVEHRWTEGEGPLHACGMRFWHTKKKCTDHRVLVTTELKLNALGIVRHDEERPEIEPDYEHMKRGGWQLQKLSSPR